MHYAPWFQAVSISSHRFCDVVVIFSFLVTILPISYRIDLLTPGKSYHCSHAREVILNDMGKINWGRNHNKLKQKWTVCIFLWTYCNHVFRQLTHLTLLILFDIYYSRVWQASAVQHLTAHFRWCVHRFGTRCMCARRNRHPDPPLVRTGPLLLFTWFNFYPIMDE